MANKNLHNAKRAKNDEFYTQLSDIENELKHYKEFFKNKIVYCNCDDPLESNFTKYFILRFHDLGLKKLICTFYDVQNTKLAYAFEYRGEDLNGDGRVTCKDIEIIRTLKAFHTPLADDDGFDPTKKEECWSKGIYGKGDFRSKHCRLYLSESDVVVTNPPFSLFREYITQLIGYEKFFLVIGSMNAISYKEIFPLIKNNKLWLGMNWVKEFIQPNKEIKKFGNICWFTNISHNKRIEGISLYYEYNVDEYPKYDNYDAIEVSEVRRIPKDYNGIMGVPITFLDKYCPTQFEILGVAADKRDERECFIKGAETYLDETHKKFVGMVLKGKATYSRILIRRI